MFTTRLLPTTLMISAIATHCLPAAADPVLDWNEVMVQSVAPQNPFAQARIAATMHAAVFEAVNTIAPEYEPYLGTLTAADGASQEAAVIAAAHAVLKTYVPASAAAVDAARATSLNAILDGPAKDDGILVGEAAAAAVLMMRTSDGSVPPEFHLPASDHRGAWQLTPSCPPAGGILLHWRNLRPFAIHRTDQFRSAPPPALRSWRYTKDYAEVKFVGSASSAFRPQDRTDVARFYGVVLAVATWNPAARQISIAQGRSLAENARAFALLNMAISDALATVMETKYHYRFWRPETAIHAGDMDGNILTRADSEFAPLIPAPCFPSYPSAHASASYAAREVLERVFGRAHHLITLTTAALPDIVLQYSKLSTITADIDDARVYGGIHFRFDQEAGAVQGKRIGAFVHANTLRPVSRCRGRGPQEAALK